MIIQQHFILVLAHALLHTRGVFQEYGTSGAQGSSPVFSNLTAREPRADREANCYTRSQEPLFSERNTASIAAILAIASVGGMGAPLPSRSALAKASSIKPY